MDIQLLPISKEASKLSELLKDPENGNIYEMYRKLYQRSGYHEPWIGYFALLGENVVGSCGFKGIPKGNTVEIAYYTYHHQENQGIATALCGKLVLLALKAKQDVVITAQTLMEQNSSTRVLEKNSFYRSGFAVDHEVGKVWEWTYACK